MFQSSGLLNSLFHQERQHFIEYLQLLRRLAKNTEIKEVAYHVPEMRGANWVEVQQIAQHLRGIAESGKKLSAHTNGGNLKTLYLLALAHNRYAAEHANFIIQLPAFSSYFFKGLLEKIGITVETQSAGRYKSGSFESFTRTSISKESKQSMSTLIQGMRKILSEHFQQTPRLNKSEQTKTIRLLQDQALIQSKDLQGTHFLHGRMPPSYFLEHVLPSKASKNKSEATKKDSPSKVSSLAEKTNYYDTATAHIFGAPLSSKHATPPRNQASAKVTSSSSKSTGKSIDKSIKEKWQKRLMLIHKVSTPESFLKRTQRQKFRLVPLRKTRRLAVVSMEGSIRMGVAQDPPQSNNINAFAYGEVFKGLMESKEEAVFLHINSPGGSADASEILFQNIYELSRIKPVFALLGGVAASGGYYIACAANRIYATNLTLCGSIGVIRIRPNLQKLYTHLGVRKETLNKDRTYDVFSEAGKLSAPSQKLLQKSIQDCYDLFLGRVALGRAQSKAQVLKMAEGRVFTARQFQEKGLIDGLLSFLEVVEEYKRVSGIPQHQKFRLSYYPQIKTNAKMLLNDQIRSKQSKILFAATKAMFANTQLSSSHSLEELSELYEASLSQRPMAWWPYF